MKAYKLVLLMICCVLLISCASNKVSDRLAKKDLDNIKELTVVRYETPAFEYKTLTGGFLITFQSEIDGHYTKDATKGTLIPDFGELLMKKFVEHVSKDIPSWPKMSVVEKPVDKYYSNKNGSTLILKTERVWLTAYGGLTILGNVFLVNSSQNIVFDRQFWYRSSDFNLKKGDRDDYVANNCKLLKEEMPIAAELTAKDLIIKYLK
jgi:hypothetical protein